MAQPRAVPTAGIDSFIKAAIQQYRAKLLDLSSRNPLVNFRHYEKSRSHIRIVDEISEKLFDKLNASRQMVCFGASTYSAGTMGQPAYLSFEGELRYSKGFIRVADQNLESALNSCSDFVTKPRINQSVRIHLLVCRTSRQSGPALNALCLGAVHALSRFHSWRPPSRSIHSCTKQSSTLCSDVRTRFHLHIICMHVQVAPAGDNIDCNGDSGDISFIVAGGYGRKSDDASGSRHSRRDRSQDFREQQ